MNPEGGQELFIIGKNFSKGSKAYFVENDADGKEIWSAEADIDQDNFHQVITFQQLCNSYKLCYVHYKFSDDDFIGLVRKSNYLVSLAVIVK